MGKVRAGFLAAEVSQGVYHLSAKPQRLACCLDQRRVVFRRSHPPLRLSMKALCLVPEGAPGPSLGLQHLMK